MDSLLGPSLLAWGPVRRFRAWPQDRRVLVTVAVLASLLFIPYVGAVGLGDPWETNYGEVGREMLTRNDFVFPFWQDAPFYSKPPLTMWLDAVGMGIVGTNRTPGKVALYTEWGMRLPIVLLTIASLSLLALALARTVGRRVAYASAFILATMPLYFLLARQAITDTPFEACFMGAMACAIIGLFDEKTQHRSGWWYGFYFLMGVSTLAKEFVGVLIGMVALLLYAGLSVIPWDWPSLGEHYDWLVSSEFRRSVREGSRPMPVLWAQMFRMRLLTGLGLFFAVALPWLLVMVFFAKGLETEHETFVYRYFIHDQFARLTSGVHSTERNPSFTYFIEEGGYALFTWVALLPGAVAMALRFRLRDRDPRTQVGVLAVLWGVVAFGLVASSATKFPHYIFPALPAVAILMGLFVEKVWDEGIGRHGISVLFGALFFFLVAGDLTGGPWTDGRKYMGVPIQNGGLKNFTDLFTYNHDRPYPIELLTRPVTLFGNRAVTTGDLLALVLIALGAYLFFESLSKAMDRTGRVLGLLVLALGAVPLATGSGVQASALALTAAAIHLSWAFAVFELLRAPKEQKSALVGTVVPLVVLAVAVTGLAFYFPTAQDPLLRALSETRDVRAVLSFGFGVAVLLLLLAGALRSRFLMYGTYSAFAVAFAVWFSWGHWVSLSHHWTQRDLFWRYYDKRKPGEPIASFLMDWKGETFYSRNTVKQIGADRADVRMTEYIQLPGRKWSLVEQGERLKILKDLAQSAGNHPVQVYDRDLNAKFVIVSID